MINCVCECWKFGNRQLFLPSLSLPLDDAMRQQIRERHLLECAVRSHHMWRRQTATATTTTKHMYVQFSRPGRTRTQLACARCKRPCHYLCCMLAREHTQTQTGEHSQCTIIPACTDDSGVSICAVSLRRRRDSRTISLCLVCVCEYVAHSHTHGVCLLEWQQVYAQRKVARVRGKMLFAICCLNKIYHRGAIEKLCVSVCEHHALSLRKANTHTHTRMAFRFQCASERCLFRFMRGQHTDIWPFTKYT